MKVFLERGDYKLVGDEKDIMVSHALQGQVVRWCRDNAVQAELNYVGNQERWMIQEMFKMDLWRVRDEQQRMMFALKWSGL